MFSQVLVASKLPILVDAVKSVVALSNSSTSSSSSTSHLPAPLIFSPTCAVFSFECGETGCPQPVGETSARACIARRFATAPPLKAGTLLVGIENYIHSQSGAGHVWYDRCLAVLVYHGGSGSGSVCDEAMTDIEVPEQFEPKTDPDIVALPLIGFKETVGARVHAHFESVSSQDWFQAASATNPTRQQVAADAFHRALQQLALQIRVSQTLRGSANMFSTLLGGRGGGGVGCQSLSQCMVNQVNAFLGPVRLQKNDSLGAPNHVAKSDWRDSYFIFGSGSSGAVLGAILATRLGTRLVIAENDLKNAEFAAELPEKCIVVCLHFGAQAVQEISNVCRVLNAAKKRVVLVLALIDAPPLLQSHRDALNFVCATAPTSSSSSSSSSSSIVGSAAKKRRQNEKEQDDGGKKDVAVAFALTATNQ